MLEFFRAIFDMGLGSSAWRGAVQGTWVVILLVMAFIWGRGPEKVAICIWVVVREVSKYVQNYYGHHYSSLDMAWRDVSAIHLTGDSLLFIGFLGLALAANRQYTIWIAAFQVIALFAHGIRATDEDLTMFVYILMVEGAGFSQLFLMTVGQIAKLRRKKGVYADWIWQVGRTSPRQNPRPVSRNTPEPEALLATR